MRAEFADRFIEKGLNAGWITKDDVALIKEFITGKKASSGIGLSRVNKITYTLVHWRRFLPEYRGMTIADVYEGIDAMKNGISTGAPRSSRTPSTTLKLAHCGLGVVGLDKICHVVPLAPS
jgi:hypothetical protein